MNTPQNPSFKKKKKSILINMHTVAPVKKKKI